jgi:hypothetical protein
MSLEKISPDIFQFLDKYVRSVGHLELLLFMFDGRERSWSASELRGEMRTNDNLVSEQIKDLLGAIEVSQDDMAKFQFVMDDSNLDVVRKISELYRTRRHAVIDAIYNRPLSAIQGFADAFKIGKGRK